ncbi:hypothetical protein PN499_08345 [Kamptonema animale CS-326]|uniref:hypothetical protein n=1 Tax=Kamptonema animale TaxID=92934 RepID=UPI00232C6228|nr:hypothetical protein [Kamptonema animale]MDB9511189.1 hypothetical protein [Kamptonema animale CS-326]
MNTNHLTQEAALKLLRDCGVQGTEAELMNLIYLCEHQRLALERVAALILQLAACQVHNLNEPEVLTAALKELVRSNFSLLALRFYTGFPSLSFSQNGYIKFGLKRGEFRLGLRLNSAFEQVDLSSLPAPEITVNSESGFLSIQHDRALFLAELGELKPAEKLLRELAFAPESYYYPGGETKSLYQYIARENLCDVLVLTGRLREAEQIADGIVEAYESDVTNSSGTSKSKDLLGRLQIGERYFGKQLYSGANPYARRAVARTLQGKVRLALADFKQAEAFSLGKTPSQYLQLAAMKRRRREGQDIRQNRNLLDLGHRTLVGQAAVCYALLLTRLGKLETALKVLNYSKQRAARPHNEYPSLIAYAQLALSDVYRLKGEYELAQLQIEHPLRWAIQTGQQEIYCWAHLSLARLKQALNQLPEARSAVNEAYSVASRHEFKLYEIDSLVTAGWIALSEEDLIAANSKANAALELVSDPDMAYAWGHGNALHLIGDILSRQGNLERARLFLSGAARLRERIEDPRFNNTQALLNNITQ